jgi:peroxiredoxin
VEQAEALKAKGVQVVACLSVNDVFVVGEWGRANKTEGKVRCGACRGSGQRGGFCCDLYSLSLRFGSWLTPLEPLGR